MLIKDIFKSRFNKIASHFVDHNKTNACIVQRKMGRNNFNNLNLVEGR